MIKYCEICNKEFETNYLQTKVCSKICKLNFRRLKRTKCTKLCSICGISFIVKSNDKICSKECKIVLVNNYKLKNEKIVIKKCIVCSSDFRAINHSLTCSLICSKKSINIRVNKRYNNDINFKLCDILRSRLKKAIKNNQKTGSAVSDLGCSIEDFKTHIEKQFFPNPRTGETMTWNNWTLDGWHIDHIKPLSSFNLENREELLKACHYTNLQPLWAKENIIKKDKY